jgi:hypothetical protein
VDRIFYLIPKFRGDGDIIDLYLPRDLIAKENGEIEPTLGFGVFAFLRTPRNRGKPRYLSFPAVLGFGENARVIVLKLQSDYLRMRQGGGNRFWFDPETTTGQFDIETSFFARRFPPQFQLAGTAEKLSSYSLWALIPEDREYLEQLWTQHSFYLTGHGSIGDNGDA